MPALDTNNPSDSPLVSVLIVEDQEMLRVGLKYTLEYMPELQVVGMANDGPTGVEKALQLQPKVILMDIGLPGFDGIEATRRIKAASNCRILMLTSYRDEKSVYASLEAGADGYCLKDASRSKLLTAISSVASGATWLDDEVSQCILKSSRLSNPDITTESMSLSDAELKVLGMVLEGASSDEIAISAGLTNEEVHTYLKKLIQRVSWSRTSVDKNPRRAKQSTDFKASKVCPSCHFRFDKDCTQCPFDRCDLEEDPLIGSIFADRYEILSVLGSGTSGVVYKARHRYMPKTVAIKIMHFERISDIVMLKRFRQEAAAASSLSHQNIVGVIDFGLSPEGQAFMIMDFLGGRSLDELIFQHGGLAANRAVEVFKQICNGLAHAHDNGIIHRDVKPNNVLVENYEEGHPVVKLVDFGTAKLVVPEAESAGLTNPGQIFGSPTYMSPEQCMGLELEPSSDVYSMGTLMYQSLVGHPPFTAENMVEAMYKQVNEECPPISAAAKSAGKTIDNRLQAIVMKALRKNKYQRHQSMHELKQDLCRLST